MNRKIQFAPGEFYHVYNRGNDKRIIFIDNSDYKRFVSLLFFCNSHLNVDMQKILREFKKEDNLSNFIGWRGKTLVDIGALCLMPNHFHLLIHEKEEEGITMFIQKVCTAYSMYFNLKYKRKGKLFEGAYCATHADSDEYLKYLFTYIHLNPLKLTDPLWRDRGVEDILRSKKYLTEYQYSSFGCSPQNKIDIDSILNLASFPEYFLEKDMETSALEWVKMARKFCEGEAFTKVGITSFAGFLLFYNQIIDLAIFS